MSSGQSHETTFCQVLSDWLQVPFDCIRFVANDSERVSVGGGSHSGRSMRLISIALRQAVDALLARGIEQAAPMLQAAPSDVRYSAGTFTSGRASVDLWTLARAQGKGLESAGEIFNQTGGFPYGSHVCEVEVDPETGDVKIERYAVVDDVGTVMNPIGLKGQIHGGVAQGLGQALMEQVAYDPESGQLLSGSFMDYAMPRADTTCNIDIVSNTVPTKLNPLGAKGAGEAGTVGALPVIVNAVLDALRPLGVKDIEMPVTSERVWRAINQGAK